MAVVKRPSSSPSDDVEVLDHLAGKKRESSPLAFRDTMTSLRKREVGKPNENGFRGRLHGREQGLRQVTGYL